MVQAIGFCQWFMPMVQAIHTMISVCVVNGLSGDDDELLYQDPTYYTEVMKTVSLIAKIINMRASDSYERCLAKRLAKALLRRHGALSSDNFYCAGKGVYPSHKQLTTAETAIINSIPGVPAATTSTATVAAASKSSAI